MHENRAARHAPPSPWSNLPLERQQIYTSSDKSTLPGALRDNAPNRWGQQLIRRVFRKAGEQRALSEIDYLLAINDRTRIGALRYRREGEETFDHNIGRYYRVPPLIRLPALLTPSPKPQLIRADQPKIATESVHPLTRVAVMLIAPLNLRGDRLDTTSCSLMESGTCQP